MVEKGKQKVLSWSVWVSNSLRSAARAVVADDAGQGVSEYIIILAVIAIAAILLANAFHEQLAAVWDKVTGSLGDLA